MIRFIPTSDPDAGSKNRVMWVSPHEWLFDLSIDPVTRRPTSWWPNVLVLLDADVRERPKFDPNAKDAATRVSTSLRGRWLQNAVLGGYLQQADLTGAQLQGAYLINAELQGALLDGRNFKELIFYGPGCRGPRSTGRNLRMPICLRRTCSAPRSTGHNFGTLISCGRSCRAPPSRGRNFSAPISSNLGTGGSLARRGAT